MVSKNMIRTIGRNNYYLEISSIEINSFLRRPQYYKIITFI